MAKFDKIAPIYNSFLIQVFYSIVHNNIIKMIKRDIFDLDRGKKLRVLDLACGPANFLRKLKKINHNLDLSGLDESAEMIKIARKRNKNINLIIGKADNLPFGDGLFDLITIIDAFYYFQDKQKVFSECFRTMAAEKYLVVSTISIDRLFSRALIKTSRISPLEKESVHLNSKDLIAMAERAGFRFVKKEMERWPGTFFLKYWNFVFKK